MRQELRFSPLTDCTVAPITQLGCYCRSRGARSACGSHIRQDVSYCVLVLSTTFYTFFSFSLSRELNGGHYPIIMSTANPGFSYVFKQHAQPGSLKRDRVMLEQMMNQPPQKTIACQRCRKLRKKCSKHSPQCVTCLRMGQDCVYADDRNGASEDTLSQSKSPALVGTTKPAPLLPPLQSDWGNYTHRTSTDMNRAPSLPSISFPSSDVNAVLPAIKLPSINAAQLASMPSVSETRQDQSQKQRLSGPTEIQSALLSTIISLGKQNLQPLTPTSQPLLLPREVAVKCIDSYFNQCDQLYPFINKQSFLSKFETSNLFNILNPSCTISPREKKQCFQTYMMLSIGFHDMERMGASPTGLSKEEIYTYSHIFSAESVGNWLKQGTLSLRTYEDIVCMTLLVLDSFHQRNCLSTTNLSNILTGLILRYHYHRRLSSTEIQKVYKDDTWALELRYRLFWTVYVLDRTISTYLNKPIAIPDELITTPYPLQTHQDPENFSTDFHILLDLKHLEGDIFTSVHSVTSINTNAPSHNDKLILQPLRKRIESWYLTTTTLTKSSTFDPLWLTTMYFNALTLLHRPSYLVSQPSQEIYARLSRAVTQNLTYTYNAKKSGCNWLEMFRVLIVFKSLLRCFAMRELNVKESRTELSLALEIARGYRGSNDDWAFLDDVALIFQRLLKSAFDDEDNEVLVKEASLAGDQLEELLEENSIGCRLDDRIEEEYGA